MAVFILETHYASGRIIRLLHCSSSIKTGRIIRRTISIYCSSAWLCVLSIKTGTRRIMRLDELSSVVRLLRRRIEHSSSRRIMRLVPVFILRTHNQTNNKCLRTIRIYRRRIALPSVPSVPTDNVFEDYLILNLASRLSRESLGVS